MLELHVLLHKDVRMSAFRPGSVRLCPLSSDSSVCWGLLVGVPDIFFFGPNLTLGPSAITCLTLAAGCLLYVLIPGPSALGCQFCSVPAPLLCLPGHAQFCLHRGVLSGSLPQDLEECPWVALMQLSKTLAVIDF